MKARERRQYQCPNPTCGGTRMVLVPREPAKGRPRGNQQPVYQCRDCGQLAGEAALERARRLRTVTD